MLVSSIQSEFPGAATALRAVVHGDGRADRQDLELAVPEGSTVLVVTMTDVGPDGFLRPAAQTDPVLTDRRGERVLTPAEAGQIVTVIDNPEPGTWTLGIFRRRRGPRRDQCVARRVEARPGRSSSRCSLTWGR